MEKIRIARYNAKIGYWKADVDKSKFTFDTVDDVEFAITECNFYADTDKMKSRFKFMKCDSCSYNHLFHVYGRLTDGCYSYLCSADENSLNERVKIAVQLVKNVIDADITEKIDAVILK